MKINWSAILFLISFLSSCAFFDTHTAKYQSASPDYSWVQDPPAGRTMEAETGQIMSVESLAAVFDGFISQRNYEIDIPGDAVLFPKRIAADDEFVVWGHLPNGDLLLRNMAFARAYMNDRQPSKLELTLIARGSGEVYGYAPFSPFEAAVRKFDAGIKLLPQKVSVGVDYRLEAIYQGTKRDVLTLECLEFLGNTGEPSSRQLVSFHLPASKTVGCKGMLIDILNAKDNAVTFVLKRYLVSP